MAAKKAEASKKVRKQGPSRIRARYRRNAVEEAPAGSQYESCDIVPSMVSKVRVVAPNWERPVVRGQDPSEKAGPWLVFRPLPALDETNPERILPSYEPSPEDPDVLEATPWYEIAHGATFGTPLCKQMWLLGDPADPDFGGSAWTSVNPYAILYRTCNTRQAFKNLIYAESRDERIFRRYSRYMYFQAWVLSEAPDGEPAPRTVDDVLNQRPTVVRLNNLAVRAVLEALEGCLAGAAGEASDSGFPARREFVAPENGCIFAVRHVPGVEGESVDREGRYEVRILEKGLSKFGKSGLTPDFNGALTADLCIDRWIWWQDLLNYPSAEQLCEAVAGICCSDPEAARAIRFAWSTHDQFLTPTVRRLIEEGVRRKVEVLTPDDDEDDDEVDDLFSDWGGSRKASEFDSRRSGVDSGKSRTHYGSSTSGKGKNEFEEDSSDVESLEDEDDEIDDISLFEDDVEEDLEKPSSGGEEEEVFEEDEKGMIENLRRATEAEPRTDETAKSRKGRKSK